MNRQHWVLAKHDGTRWWFLGPQHQSAMRITTTLLSEASAFPSKESALRDLQQLRVLSALEPIQIGKLPIEIRREAMR